MKRYFYNESLNAACEYDTVIGSARIITGDENGFRKSIDTLKAEPSDDWKEVETQGGDYFATVVDWAKNDIDLDLVGSRDPSIPPPPQ